jgi:hypothetical protein
LNVSKATFGFNDRWVLEWFRYEID